MSHLITLIFRLCVLALLLSLFLPPLQPFLVLTAMLAGLSFLAALLVGFRVRGRAQPDRRVAVIDGSNVMHWRTGTPRLDTLREVIDALRKSGFTPGVVFDANAGHLLTGRYRHDDYFERALGLSRSHVIVVPKGTQADPLVLQAARDFDAPVVSNDRFRDWAVDFPEIARKGHLINGGYRSGKLWLNLPRQPDQNLAPQAG